MKTILLKFLIFIIFIFNLSCAQNYDWKKMNDGLYLSEIGKPKGKILTENDSVNIEMYRFRPNDEINFDKSIDRNPIKKSIKYSKLANMLNYEKKFKLRKNNEYLIKKFNEKKIPNYELDLSNNITKEKLKEIINSINKQYGVSTTESVLGRNEKNEIIVNTLTIEVQSEIDIEKVKKEFENYII